MTAAQDRHISELEREIIAANVRIRYLEAEIASQPAQNSMVREVVQHIEQPTAAEMMRLYSIVTTRWPRLAHPQPERGLALFTAALAFMSSAVSHSDKRSMLSAGSWVDHAEQWLRARARPSDMSWAAICAAAVCLGFGHARLDGQAHGWELWISEGSHRPPGSAAWRGILQGQPLRPPMPFDVSRRVMPERVVIRAGQGDGRPISTW